jgi:hypothetical protein
MAKKTPQMLAKDGTVMDKAFFVAKLASNDAWLMRGVVAIYNCQTADEQSNETTSHDNGIGFNGLDAQILSSFAKQIGQRGFLTPKQIAIARKKMVKYAGQLLRIAQDRSAAVQS